MVSSQAPIPIISTSRGNHDPVSTKEVFDKTSSSSMTIRQALMLAKDLFTRIGIETSFLDAQLLLAFVLNKSPLFVHIEPFYKLTLVELDIFFGLVARRLMHEPVAYITGQKEFFGLPFMVSKNCLIPRPETEIVVEICLSLLARDSSEMIIDLCCGSGSIGIALLRERPQLFCIAVDISEEALALTKKNAQELKVRSRIDICWGDLFNAIKEPVMARLIVTNPPYIASEAIKTLPRCVRDFEPKVALDGGPNGTRFYEKILKEASSYLLPRGYLVMEIGFDQSETVKNLVGPEWSIIEIFSDLAGHDRGIVLQKR